jgi:hypothetical protein
MVAREDTLVFVEGKFGNPVRPNWEGAGQVTNLYRPPIGVHEGPKPALEETSESPLPPDRRHTVDSPGTELRTPVLELSNRVVKAGKGGSPNEPPAQATETMQGITRRTVIEGDPEEARSC